MQVEGAKQENGANIQQWGTIGDSINDVWKLVDAGDGYFYLISQIGDGNTFYLDAAEKSIYNGANIEIYKYTGGDNQKFYIEKNSNGSYIIKTKITNIGSAIEVADAGKENGYNVQQWSLNNYPNQEWEFEEVSLKLKGKKKISAKAEKEIVKTELYKNDDCVHTVVFVK